MAAAFWFVVALARQPAVDPARRALLALLGTLALARCLPRRGTAASVPRTPPVASSQGAPSTAPRGSAPVPTPPAAPAPPAGPPLLTRFPALVDHVHPVRIATVPTPVTRATELGAAIGVPRLWVKRDDLVAAPYGGGKIRKLELLLGAALHAGHRAVVTSGAVGSHHALATAIYAHRLGLDCTLLLLPGVRTPETCSNLRADAHHGAALELAGSPAGVASSLRRRSADEPAPYVIPMGGTSPVGNLAYVDAALELAAQVEAGALPPPDTLVVALGSMGTAVGLVLGLELSGLDTEVVAVRVSNVPTSTLERFQEQVATTRAWLATRGLFVPEPRPDRYRIEGRFLGAGYGQPTARGDRAIAVAAAHGLSLEATYTGKAFAAIVSDAARLRDRTVLFWHTHSALPPPTGGVTRASLPRELRGYCPPET